MSKKFSKFLFFTAVAGAATYGAYSYFQKKEQTVSPSVDDADDDFDDFSEDLDEDLNSGKERSYVSLNLDKAEAIAVEAFHKAKEVFTDSVQQVKETVKSVADSQNVHTSFTDLSEPLKEQAAASAENASEAVESTAEAVKEEAAEAAEEVKEAEEALKAKAEETEEQVEEFFDDDDPTL